MKGSKEYICKCPVCQSDNNISLENAKKNGQINCSYCGRTVVLHAEDGKVVADAIHDEIGTQAHTR